MKNIKTTLMTNAASAILMGLPLVLLPAATAALFGTDMPAVFTVLGIVLLSFGGFVGFIASQKPINTHVVWWFVSLDIGWLLGCVVVVGAQMFSLSPIGYLLVGLSGAWVTAMAFFQYRGIVSANRQAMD